MVTGSDSIPSWRSTGLLPPYVGELASSSSYSPYRISLADMVLRFGYTSARRELLTRFLDFRASLHAIGLTEGIQWVNGSFVENSHQTKGREPNDIDIVTFWRMPSGYTQETLYRAFPDLFDRRMNRRKYRMDTLFVELNINNLHYLIRQIAYWNSLWSHTRGGQWKGYLEINLSGGDDEIARNELNRMQA